MDLEEAIGRTVREYEEKNTYEIIGVVDDYHQLSLKYQIQPQVFRFNRTRGDIAVRLSDHTSFDDLRTSISSLEDIWKKVYENQPFEYYFLDAKFNDQYIEEADFRKLFSFFAALSLFMTCLGLLGLSLFLSLKRKKEVGVRKVFGASSLRIVTLFTKDYVKQVLVATLLGAPAAYLIMETWLETFSFKTAMTGESFLVPCLLLVLVAILTTAYQTVRASVANPTETLKEE